MLLPKTLSNISLITNQCHYSFAITPRKRVNRRLAMQAKRIACADAGVHKLSQCIFHNG